MGDFEIEEYGLPFLGAGIPRGPPEPEVQCEAHFQTAEADTRNAEKLPPSDIRY